ncbi:MAG: hypothetical protein J5772_03810 [Clostridia bacterium]|nr:hypothetical protein [Clostridia bacterium]
MNRASVRAICLIMAVLTAAAFAGCSGGKLNGTYKSSGLIAQTFTFSGDNVTMSAFGVNANGTYKIKGDTIYITYTLLGQEYTWSQPFSKSGKMIVIGGTVFEKQ